MDKNTELPPIDKVLLEKLNEFKYASPKVNPPKEPTTAVSETPVTSKKLARLPVK